MPERVELAELDFSRIVRRGDRVAWGQAGAEPVALTSLLMAQRGSIGSFDAFIGVSLSETPDPAYADVVRFSSFCGTGSNARLAKAGQLDICPVHYSQIVYAIGPIDVLLLQLAPPRDGRFSLGVAYEYLLSLLPHARVVVAEVNDQVPWTYSSHAVTADDLDLIVETSRALLAMPAGSRSPVDDVIAQKVAGLIENGSTLQLGIGALPDAILHALGAHRELGVHSGAIGDAVAALTEAGVITNARKSIDAGTTVTGLLLGTDRIYRFAHLNRGIRFESHTYTHGADVLGRIEKFVALNTAIEVDLTGQINAEEIAGAYVGSVGGAGDFLRGAARSRGGLPVVALRSTAGRGLKSRIVARLSGPVSTARSDAGLIVTEHGIADLRGKSLRERKRLMLDIAAPHARASLETAAAERTP